MKTSVKQLLAGLQLLGALAIAGAVLFWAPVCTGLLTLENGNLVAMKCAHAAKLFLALAILCGIAALAALIKRKADKGCAMVSLAGAVLLFANTFPSALGIGVCASPTMACQATALWVRIGAAIIGVCALFVLASGDQARRIPG